MNGVKSENGENGVNGLELVEVSRDFRGVHAVRSVSLIVRPREVVAVVGPNGSGKTTVVNLASGAVAPSSGRVIVDGEDLTGADSARFAGAGVIRSFQGVRLFDGLSVLSNVEVGAQRGARLSLARAWVRTPGFRRHEAQIRRSAMKALEAVGLADLAQRPVKALSFGQRRRVELARAFAARPAYLVLDEPSAGVDGDQLGSLATLVSEATRDGAGVLLVEHDTSLVARLADRVLGMVDGSVVAEGALSEVAAHPLLSSHLATTDR